MSINYRDTLKKYIDYVSLREGQFFWPNEDDGFDDVELMMIEKLINEIVYDSTGEIYVKEDETLLNNGSGC